MFGDFFVGFVCVFIVYQTLCRKNSRDNLGGLFSSSSREDLYVFWVGGICFVVLVLASSNLVRLGWG